MIFVNNLAEVKGLPWWTYHRGDVNGMTYVDMVFPGFLFLMGMSIPLAVDGRLARGQSKAKVWSHVAIRSLSLLALGLFIANALHVDARYTHMSAAWWTFLGFVGIALGWMRYPGETRHEVGYRAIHYSGWVLMAVLFVIFRRLTPSGLPARLDFSYWEILGLLGWAYLLVSTLYLLFAKRFKILLVLYAAMVALNALSTMGWLKGINTWPRYWNPFEGGLASLTMAGVLASLIIAGGTIARTFRQRANWILGSAALLLAIGFALQPLGISKNRDTPTWCLYCTAANLLIAILLYWLADVKGGKAWANFAKPVGENPLFAYILAYIPFLLPQLSLLSTRGTSGSWGVLKSALLTGLALVITRLLVRAGITLRV